MESFSVLNKFPKAVIGRLVLFFLLGVISSLVQAWGAILIYDLGLYGVAARSRYRPFAGQFFIHESKVNGKGPYNEFGHAWWYTKKEYPYGITTVFCTNGSEIGAGVPWPTEWESPSVAGPPPKWSLSSSPPQVEMIVAVSYELAVGWPFQCWYGAIWIRNDSNGESSFYWGMPYTKVVGYDPIFLPYQPMRGLIANALVFGVPEYLILLSVLQLKRRVRNRRRSRKGRCVYCNYDIAEVSVCPECGQDVQV